MVNLSPEPEKLGKNCSDEAVDEDVRPHELTGQLEGLEAGVVKQEEAGPQQQQVEQTHKPWETHSSFNKGNFEDFYKDFVSVISSQKFKGNRVIAKTGTYLERKKTLKTVKYKGEMLTEKHWNV